jgi:hypothetical protein
MINCRNYFIKIIPFLKFSARLPVNPLLEAVVEP